MEGERHDTKRQGEADGERSQPTSSLPPGGAMGSLPRGEPTAEHTKSQLAVASGAKERVGWKEVPRRPWWRGGTHTPLTHAHRALHFECRGAAVVRRGDARIAPPCPTTSCVWRSLPYLTLPLLSGCQIRADRLSEKVLSALSGCRALSGAVRGLLSGCQTRAQRSSSQSGNCDDDCGGCQESSYGSHGGSLMTTSGWSDSPTARTAARTRAAAKPPSKRRARIVCGVLRFPQLVRRPPQCGGGEAQGSAALRLIEFDRYRACGRAGLARLVLVVELVARHDAGRPRSRSQSP